MSNWALVSNENTVLTPDLTWNASDLAARLRGVGINVTLPATAPVGPIFFQGVKLLPVADKAATPAGKVVDSEELVVDGAQVVWDVEYRDLTEEELNPTPSASQLERWALENKYLEATKALMALAGVVPEVEWPKLADVQFETTAAIAVDTDAGQASLLLATLNYTFFQLKLAGVRWEDITYHEIE